MEIGLTGETFADRRRDVFGTASRQRREKVGETIAESLVIGLHFGETVAKSLSIGCKAGRIDGKAIV